MAITISPKISRFAIAAVVAFLSIPYAAALDKNGKFESQQERDTYIAVTLKKMATEMNSQAPIQLDEDTRMMSVIALQKTLTFNIQLFNYKASQVNPNRFSQVIKENLDHTVCKSKATRDLIDLGVQYVYLYSGNDGKLVTRIVIDKYRC